MLTQVHIKNLAVVSALELTLAPGMTALTGETGAGKSILVDSLGLCLGGRTDNDMIRAGCDRAEVTAIFDVGALPSALEWLRDQGLDEAGECMLRRVLVRDGRSRSFINGSPAPMSAVQELGDLLVDIHGQHAHQSLLRRDAQRRLLDEYAGHMALAAEVADLYRRLSSSRTRLEALTHAARDRAAKLELLRYQIGELEALGLAEGELEQLDSDHGRLSNAGRIQETCGRLFSELYDDDASIHARLSQALAALEDLLGVDPALEELRELVEGSAIQVQEAASGLRSHLDSLDLDPALLDQVESRLGDIHDLARKYHIKPAELDAYLSELRGDLETLENADIELGQLERETSHLREEFLSRAGELGDSRSRHAKDLERKVGEAMHRLGMPGGRFAVDLRTRPEEEANSAGRDDVELLVSTNPGQPLQPLAKVASGGELSRISLAIQVVTARCGTIPTLIFDEVDVGIGGRVAEIVGQLLRRLGESRQVLCVTHLPQVAALGHHHLQVRKDTGRNETHTHITPLGDEERVTEVARMLGGIEITEQTLSHARDMVTRAQSA